MGGRYAVFDVQYELETGEGTRNKISAASLSVFGNIPLTKSSIHLLGSGRCPAIRKFLYSGRRDKA
jgi:hypothetical protein